MKQTTIQHDVQIEQKNLKYLPWYTYLSRLDAEEEWLHTDRESIITKAKKLYTRRFSSLDQSYYESTQHR